MKSPFDRPQPEIALVVYTNRDPIHLRTVRMLDLLQSAGIFAKVVEVDWASHEEWERLMDPMDKGDAYGRHSIRTPRDDSHVFVCRWYGGPGGGFVRDFEDESGDLFPVIP